MTPAGFGGFGLKTTGGRFASLGLKTQGGYWDGMWHHQKAYVEAKLSREGFVAVRCKELNLDHYAPRVKWFKEISKGSIGNV